MRRRSTHLPREIHRRRVFRSFVALLDRVLSGVLGRSDQSLFFQSEAGHYRVIIPGVDEAGVKRLVRSLLKVLEQNKDAVPLRFGYQIEVLNSADEQD